MADLGRIVGMEWESELMRTYVAIHCMVQDLGDIYVHDIEGKAGKEDLTAFYGLIDDTQKNLDDFRDRLDCRHEIHMGRYAYSLKCLSKAVDAARCSQYRS